MAKKLLFTGHAKARCDEFGLSFRKIKDGFKYAKVVEAPPGVKFNNQRLRPQIATKLQYRWRDGVLYTILNSHSYWKVLTITLKDDPSIVSKVEHPL